MSSLLLLLFCGCLSLATGSVGIEAVNRELLITVKQRQNEISLTIIPETDRPESKGFFETKNIPGVALPPDCGHDYFRCSVKVSPSSTTPNENDILIPLDRALLVVEVKFSNKSLKATFGSHAVIDIPESYCSPTTFLEIFEKLYAVCMDLQNKIVTLFEIPANITTTKQSPLIGPLFRVWLGDFNVSDVKTISNVLLSTAIPHQPLLYFAIDNYLFTVSPTEGILEYGPNRIGRNCRYIHRLVPAPRDQILAYCLSGYIYYDTEQQTWLSEYTYTDSGVPYLCPDQNYVINAYDGYLSYSIGTKEHTMPHVSVASGMCINGSEGVNIFAYNDKDANSAALIELAELSPVNKTTLCSDQDCLPIIALGDPVRYLLIRQRTGDLENVTLLNVENNLKAKSIISVSQEASDMFALVHVKAAVPDQRRHFPDAIIAGVIFAAVALVVVFALILAGLGCYYSRQRYQGHHSHVTPMPASENVGQGAPMGPSLQEAHPPPPIPVSPAGQTAPSQRQPGNDRLIEDNIKKSPEDLLKLYAPSSGKPLEGVESIPAQVSIIPIATVHITNNMPVGEVGGGTTAHTFQALLTQGNEMAPRTTADSEFERATPFVDNDLHADDTRDRMDVDSSDTCSNESAPLISNDQKNQ